MNQIKGKKILKYKNKKHKNSKGKSNNSNIKQIFYYNAVNKNGSINRANTIENEKNNNIIILKSKREYEQNFNNYNYHNISNGKIYNHKINNNGKNLFKHYNSNLNIGLKKLKLNTNYSDTNNKNEQKEINNINQLEKKVEIKTNFSSKNFSKGDIQKRIIYSKKNNSSYHSKNSLNVENNTISFVIEPSHQKNEEDLKDDNILKNKNIKKESNLEICQIGELKIRNNSENKKLNQFKIENQNKMNYNARKKNYRDGHYEGILINGKRELRGVMNYKNGGKYIGQWKNDKRHGKGVFTSPNYNNPDSNTGIKYDGEFNNDKIEGYGIAIYNSGDKYEGEWKDDKQYGRGTLSYIGGGKYVGEWKFGKFNGEGIYYLKNGERFEGKFYDNKYNGYGKYFYNSGEYLEGIFKDDYPKGNCILHKTDGSIENKIYN